MDLNQYAELLNLRKIKEKYPISRVIAEEGDRIYYCKYCEILIIGPWQELCPQCWRRLRLLLFDLSFSEQQLIEFLDPLYKKPKAKKPRKKKKRKKSKK